MEPWGVEPQIRVTIRKIRFLLIGNRFLALRGVGPEFEAERGDFHGRRMPDGAMGVKRPVFRGAGRAPHPGIPGVANRRGWKWERRRTFGAHLGAAGVLSSA